MTHWCLAPFDRARRIGSLEDRSSRKMRIIECHQLHGRRTILTLNINAARIVVANAQYVRRVIKGESGFIQVFSLRHRPSIGSHELRHEINAQYVQLS